MDILSNIIIIVITLANILFFFINASEGFARGRNSFSSFLFPSIFQIGLPIIVGVILAKYNYNSLWLLPTLGIGGYISYKLSFLGTDYKGLLNRAKTNTPEELDSVLKELENDEHKNAIDVLLWIAKNAAIPEPNSNNAPDRRDIARRMIGENLKGKKAIDALIESAPPNHDFKNGYILKCMETLTNEELLEYADKLPVCSKIVADNRGIKLSEIIPCKICNKCARNKKHGIVYSYIVNYTRTSKEIDTLYRYTVTKDHTESRTCFICKECIISIMKLKESHTLYIITGVVASVICVLIMLIWKAYWIGVCFLCCGVLAIIFGLIVQFIHNKKNSKMLEDLNNNYYEDYFDSIISSIIINELSNGGSECDFEIKSLHHNIIEVIKQD